MKRVFYFAAFALIGAVQVDAQAQVTDDACSLAEDHYAAIRNGDQETILQQHMPEFTFFTNAGDLLWTLESVEQQRSAFGMDPTFASNTFIRHCSAKVYGDTAILTYYLTGSTTRAGETTNGTWRVTEVWVRDQGAWKEAHHHESPLLGSVEP